MKRTRLKRTRMKPARRKTVPKEIRDHWQRLVDMGCMVCGTQPASIHHCHSRELSALGINRGVGQRTSHWATIPLCIPHHSFGPEAIDGSLGVLTWESRYQTQVALLQEISRRVGFDVIERARADRAT